MINLITGAIGLGIFITFVISLAVSIGQTPFILIVVIVSILISIDYYQSVRIGLKQDKENK
ncbi:MAG: hypothetical protein ACI9KN_000605 [Gammaproteobacteria bacterium]|jgi:hypothetical protein